MFLKGRMDVSHYRQPPVSTAYFRISRTLFQKKKPLKKFPFRIETYDGIADYFDFPTRPVRDLELALRKVANQAVTDYIFAQEESDFLLNIHQDLRALHRAPYDTFDEVIVVQKSKRGEEVDAILSDLIRTLKKRVFGRIFLPRCTGHIKTGNPNGFIEPAILPMLI